MIETNFEYFLKEFESMVQKTAGTDQETLFQFMLENEEETVPIGYMSNKDNQTSTTTADCAQ